MNTQALRRVGVAVFLGLIMLSVFSLSVTQRVRAEPAGVTRNYPGAAPCDTSLQACINGSADGDVINIAAGVYITSVTLNKAVSLIGAGAGSTIIQALPGQRVLTVTAAMNTSTQIAGLTIQGGNAGAANGGGLFLSAGAQPLIQNVTIIANSALSGGGIYASSPITLLNVTVNNNFATNGSGGGMYAAGNLIATNCVFQNNTVITNGYGGGVLANANFTGTNMSFIGNVVNNGYDGGGLYAAGALKLASGQFLNNRTTKPKGYGGGGGLISFGLADISGTLFSGNTSSDWGGGAYLVFFANSAPSVLTNVQFINNTALSGGGGGLFMWLDSALTSVDFMSNTAGYRGGGLYAGYAGSYTTTIAGGLFLSNTASGGGGLYSDGSFTLNGPQFLSNTSRSGNGGGAWAQASANVVNAYFAYNTVIAGGNSGGLDTGNSAVISDTTFFNNRTLTGGGGGSGAGGNTTLNNVQYIGNWANSLGGGLLSFGSVHATGSRFENNVSAVNWGGGFFASQATLITNTDFISNTSAYAGGGLGVQYGSVTVTGGIFERNLATTDGWGGAIYNGGPSLTISGTQFLSNTALATGGGTVGNITFLTNTIYINNSAGSWGGGAEAFGPIQVFNSLFQNNRTQANGGGISSSSSVDISRSQFFSNTAQGDGTYGGGAIAATLSIAAADSQFIGNTANTSPGGALATGQDLSLTRSDFSGNTATSGDGGAIWVRGAAMLDRVALTNNQSGARGGAVFISNTVTVSNSQFVNNFATSGAGLYQAGGGGRIVNSLLARNAALSGQGMALYLAPTTTLQIWFTTIAAPSLSTGDAIRITSGNVDIQNTVIASHTIGLNRLGGNVFADYDLFFGNSINKFGSITGGTHDASGDPKFIDSNSDDYHLRPGSAAIDAGVSQAGITDDFEDDPRPIGDGVDIGFDESSYNTADVSIVKSATPATASPGQLITYTLDIGNSGPVMAKGVVVTDSIPLELTNLEITSSGATITQTASDPHVWQISPIALEAHGFITVAGIVDPNIAVAAFTNTASVAATTIETNTLNNQAAVRVTIPQVAFASGTYTVAENVSPAVAQISVNVLPASTITVTVHFSTTAGMATPASDYLDVSGLLTFGPGQSSQSFAVPIIDDLTQEMNETVNLILSSPHGSLLGTPTIAALIIVDNDNDHLTFLPLVMK